MATSCSVLVRLPKDLPVGLAIGIKAITFTPLHAAFSSGVVISPAEHQDHGIWPYSTKRAAATQARAWYLPVFRHNTHSENCAASLSE
jgi:hypothetical protein